MNTRTLIAQVLIALFAAAPPTIAALAALRSSERTEAKAVVVQAKVEEIRHATNSMKDALVAVTRSDALQEGHAEGVAEQKAKQQGRESSKP